VIAVIDYGRGNLGSVENALGRLGMRAVVTQDPRVLEDARALVLPGDGAFHDAMSNLQSLGLLEPLKARNPSQTVVGTVLVTVGLLLILSDIGALVAGPTSRNIRLDLQIFQFQIFPREAIIVSTTDLYILLGIVALTLALHLILTRTWFGRAVRAVTQDTVGARLCGVRAGAIHAATVAFGSAIVAVAGVLYTLNYPINPYEGFSLTVKAFTIIILGGIGSLPGALLAGIFLGVAEALTGFFWTSEWAPGLSIMLLLAILVVFPRGMLRRSGT